MKLLLDKGFNKILFKTSYGWYFLAGSISLFGSSLTKIALPVLVLEKTGSGLLMGITFALEAIPSTILGPFLGALSDKMDRKKTLVLVDIIRAILIIAILFTSNIYVIFLLLALIGILRALYSPIRLAVSPDLVPKDFFSKAVALNGATQQIFNILGPTIAALIIATTNSYVALVIDSLTYLIAGILTIFITIPKRIIAKNTSLSNDIKEGFLYLFNNIYIRKLNFYWIILTFSLGGLEVLLLLFLQERAINNSLYGVLITWLTVGIFIGTIIGPKANLRYRETLLNLLPLLFGIVYTLLVFDVQFIGLVIIITLLGSLYGLYNVLASVVFGLNIPNELRGRVYANANAFTTLAFALSSFMAGAANSFFNVSTIFLIIGIITVITTILVLFTNEKIKIKQNNLTSSEEN